MAVSRKKVADALNQSPSGQTKVASGSKNQSGAENLKAFTAKEISLHDSTESLWVVVRNQVYDVTSWISKHPGGDLITLRGGKDCTVLFDSYHPLSARAVLAKFHIGSVAEADRWQADANTAEDELASGTFYHTLKQRVHAHFKANKTDPRTSTALFVKAVLILSTLVMSYYGAFFAFTSNLLSLVSAVILGVAMAEVGVSIQHDANHGAFSASGTIGAIFGATLDVVGASSFMWRQQHMVGHHVHTNVHGLDPDIRVSDADVRRVTQYQPRHWYQAYQHIYLGLLYSLLSVKSVLIDDFQSLSSGSIGSVDLKRLSQKELAVFWGGKVFWAVVYIALPIKFSSHTWGQLLAVWAISQAVTGWLLALMFQVAHVVDDVQYLEPVDASRGWAAKQVATTADFSHGSFLWTHFSGGLNYQVVHHLFPAISHTHYPAIAPIVLQTCREYNVPYKVYPSFLSAVKAHFRHLKSMGHNSSAMLTIPSLASIG